MHHATLATVHIDDIWLWNDSEIVLYWLRSEKSLKVFVENRIAKIKELTAGIRSRHVRTHDNPADLISRGAPPDELSENSLWWHGPNWLQRPSSEWPVSRIDRLSSTEIVLPSDVDREIRRTVVSKLCTATSDIINDFSTYERLVRITALCKRFIANCRAPSHRMCGTLSVEELQSIRRHWILRTQQQHYNDEIKCLSNELRRCTTRAC